VSGTSLNSAPVRPVTTEPGRVTGRQLGAGIALSALLAIVLAGATTVAARSAAPQWAHTGGLTVLIIAEVYLAIIVGLILGVRGLGRRAGTPAVAQLLALRRPTGRQLGFAFAVLILAVAAGIAVSLAVGPLTGGVAATLRAIVRDGSDQARLPTATALTWALIVLRLVALTGTAEELLFRGALYSWLRRRWSVPVTIAVTAALFALEHAYYPILLPLVLSFGLAAGWVRHRTQSIITTIAMHVCIDLALFVAAVALS
jgi:hypothetical protein